MTTTSFRGLELNAVYREQVEYVWSTLRRLGVEHAELEDVAHEVFVTVHRRSTDFEPTRPVRPWIFGIAMRVASRHRRNTRRRREVTEELLSEPQAGDRGAQGDLEQRDARRIVFDALDRLSETQRAVFVLHELEGRSVPEIADELRVPLNTVYSRLRSGRERFTSAVSRLRDKEHPR